MSRTEVVVRGVLKTDGTIELTEKPALPEGPVEVTIRPAPTARAETLAEFLERAHREVAAAGHTPRTKDQIDADIAAIRQEWDDRFAEIGRLQDECQPSGERPETGAASSVGR